MIHPHTNFFCYCYCILTFGARGSAVSGLALADVGLDALSAVAALRALGQAERRPVGGRGAARARRVTLAAHVHRTPLVDQLKEEKDAAK